MRAHLEEVSLKKEEIYKLLEDAKNALHPNVDEQNKIGDAQLKAVQPATINSKVSKKADLQYVEIVKRIFDFDQKNNRLMIPEDAQLLINQVKHSSKTISTLRKYARAVRHMSMLGLNTLKKNADEAQRAGNWDEVENIVSSKKFNALLQLSQMLPADYRQNWQPTKKRKSKKTSLSRLPVDWREQLAAESKGQFRIPMIVNLLTGVRPEELQKGVLLKLINNSLYVHIQGAKVKENAGQEYREFKLASHPLTNELIQLMLSTNKTEDLVKVKKGNSVTTHMRSVGQRIWPNRKESVTCYTGRHAMAADCKYAIAAGADPDLVSQVLGHIVDKTASYYGNRFQSGGVIVVPSEIKVTKDIKKKVAARNANRKAPGQKNKTPYKSKP